MAGLAAIVVLLVVLGLFSSATLLWGGRKKRRLPPVAGTAFHQFLNMKRLHDYHTDLSHRYKTFRLLATPFWNQIYTNDPANVEYILRINFKNYGKGWWNYGGLKDLLGDGIFAVDGDKWRHQRKLASYEFSTKVLKDYSSATFKRNAARLAQIIHQTAALQQVFDLQELFMKSTMDSIFEVGFGVELHSLRGSFEEGRKFVKAFDTCNELILKRFIYPTWKIMRFLGISHEAELSKNIQVVDDFIYKFIRTRTEQTSPHIRQNIEKKGDILSRFIEERKNGAAYMTDQYLRDIILNFMVAGKDTTAGTLSWFIYLLCKHKQVQEKAHKEVEEATKDIEYTNIDEFTNNLTEESLDKLQYIHAALSETLRLYPAVPLDSKVCFSDDTLPDGYNIRKGDIVFYQPYAMGRMKYLWGEDAEVFRPERWLDDKGLFHPESPFKFTAFQAGPRICLGKDFAYRQMKIFAAVLLRFFAFKLRDDAELVKYRTMLTLHVDQGLFVHAISR